MKKKCLLLLFKPSGADLIVLAELLKTDSGLLICTHFLSFCLSAFDGPILVTGMFRCVGRHLGSELISESLKRRCISSPKVCGDLTPAYLRC